MYTLARNPNNIFICMTIDIIEKETWKLSFTYKWNAG